jgi:hypothetical protein
MSVLAPKDFGTPVGRFIGHLDNNFVILTTKEVFGSAREGSFFGIRIRAAVSGTVFGIVRIVKKDIRPNGAFRLLSKWAGYWKYENGITSFYSLALRGDPGVNLHVYRIKNQARSVLSGNMRKPDMENADIFENFENIPAAVQEGFDPLPPELPKPDLSFTNKTKTKKAKPLTDVFLMCKDIPVYNITKDEILSDELLPGAMRRKTMDYDAWMRTRYSAGSNVTARRLMLRAFGTDNHGNVLKATRALSLSDCYWLKNKNEKVLFDEITPYLHAEWDGSGNFTGGSIATLFVNGVSDKCWVNAKTLKKIAAYKEMEVYELCAALGLIHSKAKLDGIDILVTNFTSTNYFFESAEQSGYIGPDENHIEKWIEIFGEHAVSLFVVDYLVEHDDRHDGNFGFLRSADTGEYASMAPYYDFDWAFCSNSTPLPELAFKKYGGHIKKLCEKAKITAADFEHSGVIIKRADELLKHIEITAD